MRLAGPGDLAGCVAASDWPRESNKKRAPSKVRPDAGAFDSAPPPIFASVLISFFLPDLGFLRSGKKLRKTGKVYKSTKGEGHGFGLVRMDDIVERLDGYLSRNSEAGAFTTEILIPQL